MIITKRYAQKKDKFEGVRLTCYRNGMNGRLEAFYFDDIGEDPIAALEAMTGDDKERYERFKERCMKLDGTLDAPDGNIIPEPVKVLFPNWGMRRNLSAEFMADK